MTEPTQQQIALAVAALIAEVDIDWNERREQWEARLPSGRWAAMPRFTDRPLLDYSNAAEALGLEPDPQVWGNHLRLQAIDADAALMLHHIDCPNDCTHGCECAESAELEEQARLAKAEWHKFQRAEAKADG